MYGANHGPLISTCFKENDMTKQMLTSDHPFFSNFPNWVIGHDRLFQEMLRMVDDVAFCRGNTQNTSNYPPHNLYQEEDGKYVIELAVAGFEKDELEVSTEDGRLFISGRRRVEVGNEKIIHKGIAHRSFEKSFHLAENVIIDSTRFLNGIITIWLEQVLPEEKKRKLYSLG